MISNAIFLYYSLSKKVEWTTIKYTNLIDTAGSTFKSKILVFLQVKKDYKYYFSLLDHFVKNPSTSACKYVSSIEISKEFKALSETLAPKIDLRLVRR